MKKMSYNNNFLIGKKIYVCYNISLGMDNVLQYPPT